MPELPSKEWKIVGGHHLSREYEFPDFRSALEFVNRIGQMSDEVNHHPDVYLTWGKVRLDVWTHTAGGITDRDYDWARRAEALYRR